MDLAGKSEVSIVVPVFNSENYLPAALESILNQTLKTFEVLLVCDDSSDRTRDLCREFAQHDKPQLSAHKAC